MKRFAWWLVDKLSRMLGLDERDAVLGDLEESGMPGSEALRHLMDFIFRRQTESWKDWRPWLALIGIVGLVDWRLSSFSVWLSDKLAVYCVTYWRLGTHPGDGLSGFHEVVVFSCQSLALIFWSWTAGFVLGSLSRRTIWVSAPVAGAVLLVAGGPRRVAALLLFGGLPLLLETVLLLLPSIWGVYQGRRHGKLTSRQTILLACAVAIITVLATWTGGWSEAALQMLSGGTFHPRIVWQARLASYAVMSWPVWYVVAMAISLHGRNAERQNSTFSGE